VAGGGTDGRRQTTRAHAHCDKQTLNIYCQHVSRTHATRACNERAGRTGQHRKTRFLRAVLWDTLPFRARIAAPPHRRLNTFLWRRTRLSNYAWLCTIQLGCYPLKRPLLPLMRLGSRRGTDAMCCVGRHSMPRLLYHTTHAAAHSPHIVSNMFDMYCPVRHSVALPEQRHLPSGLLTVDYLPRHYH